MKDYKMAEVDIIITIVVVAIIEWNAMFWYYTGKISKLKDKQEFLETELYKAVEVAFNRGAENWTRLNYPKKYEQLVNKKRKVDAEII